MRRLTKREKQLLALAGRLAFYLHKMRQSGDPDRHLTGGVTFELYDDLIAPDVELALAMVAATETPVRVGADDGQPSADEGGVTE